MRIKITCIIEDKTPQERIAGQEDALKSLYKTAFERLLTAAMSPGCTYRIEEPVLEDNTKEAGNNG